METVAYVYKWTHLPTLKWYVGVRFAIGCNPSDGYICSSKTVKPMILANPLDWKRSIIATGLPAEMRELETTILQTVNARKDVRSFNKANNTPYSDRNGFKASDTTRKKLSKLHKGKVISESHRLIISQRMSGENNPFYGKNHSEETRDKIREARKTQEISDVTKEKMRLARLGKFRDAKSEAHKSRISQSVKMLSKIECEFCGCMASPGNYKRWHSINCKEKK
jgi:hypothetical protein